MTQKFAVLYSLPEEGQTQFIISRATDPVEALHESVQNLVEEGHENANMIAVFSASDLKRVLEQMED